MDPQNKIGHPAHDYRQVMQVNVLNAHGIYIERERGGRERERERERERDYNRLQNVTTERSR